MAVKLVNCYFDSLDVCWELWPSNSLKWFLSFIHPSIHWFSSTFPAPGHWGSIRGREIHTSLFPTHLLQLIQRNTEAFPGQPRDLHPVYTSFFHFLFSKSTVFRGKHFKNNFRSHCTTRYWKHCSSHARQQVSIAGRGVAIIVQS